MTQVVRRVGFIGLGAMGRPMARNIMAAGYQMICYDSSGPAVEAMVREGADGAQSAAQAAADSDVLFTMLPEADDVRDVLLGGRGAVEGASEGAIFIDASTIDPMSIRDIAAVLTPRAITMLDGGVSGSPEMARQASFTLMIGGPVDAFERCRPMLEAMSRKLIYTGELGSAKLVKLANNMVGATTTASVAEAFVLAQRAGVAPTVLYEAMMGSWGRCFNLEVRPPVPGLAEGSPADQDFAADFSVDYMIKDLAYALRTAEAFGTSADITALTKRLFEEASADGGGSKDISIVGRTFERMSGPSAPDVNQ